MLCCLGLAGNSWHTTSSSNNSSAKSSRSTPSNSLSIACNHTPIPFNACSNNLTTLPDDVSEFKYLRTLHLKYNQFRKLPPVTAQLPQLSVLELAGNQITKIDHNVISAMTSLKELDLSGNMLTELPSAIVRLPKLEALHLENNRYGWLLQRV